MFRNVDYRRFAFTLFHTKLRRNCKDFHNKAGVMHYTSVFEIQRLNEFLFGFCNENNGFVAYSLHLKSGK